MSIAYRSEAGRMCSSQEDVSILADLLRFAVSELLHLLREVCSHAGVHRHLHVKWQRPHLVSMLLQGLSHQLDDKRGNAVIVNTRSRAGLSQSVQ